VTKTEGRAHPVFAALIGLTGGFATMAANAAGPIWILYLVALGLPRYAFIGTGAWFFLILNVFKLPFQAGLGNLTPAALAIDLALLPAILVGAGLGILTVKRIDESLFAGLVKGLAVLASLKLLIG
jgi:hypothetical protein